MKKVFGLCLILLCGKYTVGQTTDGVKMYSGNTYFEIFSKVKELGNLKKYDDAFALSQQLVNAAPNNGEAWLLFATNAFNSKNYKPAINGFLNTINFGTIYRPDGQYKIAQCYSFLKITDSALQWLDKSLKSGFRNKMTIRNDAAFTNYDSIPGFEKILNNHLVKKPSSARNDDWIFDIDYLLSEIKRLHFIYRRSQLPPQFMNETGILKKNVNKLTDQQVIVSIQRLLSLLGDGHTFLYPIAMKKGQLTALPLKLYYFKDGLFIIGAGENYKDLVGKKIERIGNFSSGQVFKALKNYVSRDNDIGVTWLGPSYMILPEFLKAMGAINKTEEVQFTINDNGSLTNASIVPRKELPSEDDLAFKLFPPAFSSGEVPMYLSRINQNYWFEKIDSNCVYFQFNQVQNDKKETLSDFSDRLAETLIKEQIRNLVVDVRLNNGGEAQISFSLYRNLLKYSGTVKNSRIFLITGRNTFSAAQDFISFLDTYFNNIILVGEPSSSKPIHIGDETLFMLPNSGAVGSIATGHHQITRTSRDHRQWINPAIPVELSSVEYFNNQDPVMKTILLGLKK